MGKKSKKKKKNKKQQQYQQQSKPIRSDLPVVDISSMPLLLRVFVFLGCGLKYVGIVLLVMFGLLGFTILLEYGIKAFVEFCADFITILDKENVFTLLILAGPFVLWGISAGWLKKHYKERCFKAFEDKVLIEQKKGEAISLTYEEMGLSIRTRKIKIGPDWIEIPYDTGIRQVSPEWTEGPLMDKKIRLYSFGKEDIDKLLAYLSQKCDTPYEKKMKENIGEYTVGWITTYFIGWPILFGSIYLCEWLYVLEGYKSLWELVKDVSDLSWKHPGILIGGLIGIFIILMGYLMKFLFLIRLRKYFKPYKDFFHISW